MHVMESFWKMKKSRKNSGSIFSSHFENLVLIYTLDFLESLHGEGVTGLHNQSRRGTLTSPSVQAQTARPPPEDHTDPHRIPDSSLRWIAYQTGWKHIRQALISSLYLLLLLRPTPTSYIVQSKWENIQWAQGLLVRIYDSEALCYLLYSSKKKKTKKSSILPPHEKSKSWCVSYPLWYTLTSLLAKRYIILPSSSFPNKYYFLFLLWLVVT